MWDEFIVLVTVVIVFHEVGHMIPCMRRVKGVFVGLMKRKGFVVGFVVHPLRLVDIIFPQLLVPLVLFLLFRDNTPMIIIGAISNVGGGIHDLTLIKRIKVLNSKDVDELMERTRRDLIGVFIKVQ